MEPFIFAALTMVTAVHAMAAVSRPVAAYILSALKVVLFGALYIQRDRTTPVQELLKQGLPKDVRTSMKLLGLVPDIVSYRCCRKCFAIYKADPHKPDDPFPHLCTHKKYKGGSPCNEPLVYEKVVLAVQPGASTVSRWSPLWTYHHRSLNGWLVDFLMRPQIKKHVRESWKRPTAKRWTDFMDAPAIRTLVNPDKQTLFSAQVKGEVRLVFSLFVD